uniref:WD40 repeat-like protein n=1 Tax=Mycena chlorophos TaxID=658473 RepID=A0ABQ0M8A8_MYCCL|nr:WD40 repeat-like protein [Mycena chlorophos]
MLGTQARRRKHVELLSSRWNEPFDRVGVLGADDSGHTGCVNALSWAHDGELLLSGSDDRTIRIWSMDSSDNEPAYPFVCRSVIRTRHTANIFNVHLLPHSTSIASVAGDGEVQVHEVGEGHECTHQLTCHRDRTKRIVTEDSPHLFLTVSEDGSVRQHDLRNRHDCHARACPPPLLKLDIELSTIALSPLTPYQFVVAGESEYGYLFDRRFLQADDESIVENGMTYCVRRFGRRTRTRAAAPYDREPHITGARMSATNGHEVLLSYSADAVYSYSTLDDPEEDDDSAEEDEEGRRVAPDPAEYSSVPTIMPRMKFKGARNIQTIKDVNFLGPRDEFVVSGSDCGNLFCWNKGTGELRDILEGDGVVVNVIEGHPHLPIFACSGIDDTIKLFAPVAGPSEYSRIEHKDQLIEANERPRPGFQRLSRHHFTALLAALGEDEAAECRHQ